MPTDATGAAVRGIAHSRAGLLGNPSDGYGGKAIALLVRNFRAEVTIEPADQFALRPGSSDLLEFPSLREARARFAASGYEDGMRLLRAAIARFTGHWQGFAGLAGDDPRLGMSVRYETSIPRQVGLAGSSAIVIAALRALMAWFDVSIEPAVLAELALAAELEDLGIAAGAMDRVVQSYGGLVAMDLAEPRSAASYRRLDPELLPPLFLAWDRRGGERSGVEHGNLRARWLAGDPEVLGVIERLRALVDRGVECLAAGDRATLRELMAENFALRTQIFHVSDVDREMVALAKSHGAPAKLCGSGGAVLGATAESGELAALERTYENAGFGFLRPDVGPASEGMAGRGAAA